MTYVFNPAEKYKNEPDGLIPRAIYLATLTRPAPEVQPFWQGAIYADLENHDPRFSWRNFLSTMTP